MQPLGGYSPIFLLFFAFCVSGDILLREEQRSDFNSHARVGRDGTAQNGGVYTGISTHTPV